jgi:hypothetical protein
MTFWTAYMYMNTEYNAHWYQSPILHMILKKKKFTEHSSSQGAFNSAYCKEIPYNLLTEGSLTHQN